MGIFLYLLLGIGIITQRSSTDIPGSKTIELTEGGERAITNSGFPSCCHGNETFHVKCSTPTICFVHFEFTDLDLPPGSQVRIYHGPNTSGEPMYRSGKGTKYNGSLRKEISIVLEAPSSDVDVGHYVGFRMLLRTSHQVAPVYNTRVENPCRSSPLELHMWAGASVTSTSYDERIDCIWQMKVPAKNKGLNAYLNITVNSIKGLVVVTEYITSQGHQVVHHEGQTGASTAHEENLGYFTSEHGFYIRAKVQNGRIGFRTGFYTDPAANDTRKYVCTMKYGTVTAEGVRCKDPEWCVSNETLCNEVITCGNKQDELPPFCEEAGTVSSLVPTSTERACLGPWLKTCLDGRCINTWDQCPEECVNKRGYALCTDGRCIRVRYDCDCPERQRKCPDGRCRYANIACPKSSCVSRPCPDSTCADNLDHCPGEPCPHSTSRCGTEPQCYLSRKDCDGEVDCHNAYDERPGCSAYTTRRPQSAASGQKWWIVLIVLLVLLIFIVPIIFFYRRVKNQRRETSSAEPSIRPTRREAEVRLFPVSDRSHPPNRRQGPPPSAPHLSGISPPPPAYEDVQAGTHTHHPTNHPTRDEELPPYESVVHIHTAQTSAPVQGESRI